MNRPAAQPPSRPAARSARPPSSAKRSAAQQREALPVPLHVHSCYSPLWGVPTPAELVERAVSLGYDTLAMTEQNGLYGLHFFLEAAKEQAIFPVVGAELRKHEDRALCWVRSDAGYRNLCRILSELHCNPEATVGGALEKRRDGLVVASDCPRLLGQLARAGREDLFVEVSPGHAMHRALSEARSRSLPPVATVRCVGLDAADLTVHRVLRAVAGRTTVYRLREADLARPGDLLAAPSRLADHFPHCPDAVANTRHIAERCAWRGPSEEVVFPAYRGLSPEEAYRTLRRRAYDGAVHRYGGVESEVEQRLEKELAVIRDKGFAAYFLVVADIVRGSPRTCGRGSAAASVVAYALGITHVDPVRHHLFFERFLSPGRVDPPDIDVDFPWDERDAVIDEVFRRYGAGRVAMVANQVGFKWRGAVREVARTYGVPDAEIRRVEHDLSHDAGLGPWFGSGDLARGRSGGALPPPWPEIMAVAGRLSSHLRYLSVHCGGVVIAPDSIRDHAPVEVAAKGVPVLQWEKDQVEAAGLVKIDLLGNRSLAVIRDTLEAVERNTGRAIDYAAWDPVSDPDTLELVRHGKTMGCFYIESPATRLLLRRMWGEHRYPDYDERDPFEHLVMASSIIRPAANAFIREFVNRMRGEPWHAFHPLLESVLGETYGIAIYQEQITQIAMALAGFSAEEGNELRKVLTKKHRSKRLADLAERFTRGARAHGVPGAVVDEVWKQILSFSGYSFCKPHSASYALVSLKCAYLKAHHPAEFLAAVLSNRGGYYVPFAYVSEARRLGLTVLPPCVNHSHVEYRGRGNELRVGLQEVKGLSTRGAQGMVEERESGEAYRDVASFLRRTRLRSEDARILARCGALDSLREDGNRSQILMDLDLHFQKAENRSLSLFEDPIPLEPYRSPPPGGERLRRWEWETLGFPVSFHPLDPWRPAIRQSARRGPPLVAARHLGRHVGRKVRTVGWWITGKVVETHRKEPMEFVSLEDTTAGYEATLFPDVYRRVRRHLSPLRPYLLQGVVEEEFGVPTLTVERLGFLDGGRSS